MDMIDKVVFQSQQRLALLPPTMRDVLMRCHCLDYSLAPHAVEQSILQHIFQALCFVDKSSSTSHCCLIQSNFGSPQTFLAQIYNDLFLSNPTITQLESYCVSMGMQPLELKSCSDSTAYVDYLTNCRDGSVDSAETILRINSMKLNELLILCRIHSLAVTHGDSSRPLLASVLRSILLHHLLYQPCNVNFDNLQPAKTLCITLPPNSVTQRRSSTLIALTDHKISRKLTTELLDFHQIQHSECDSLRQMRRSLKQYAKKLLNSSTAKQRQRVNDWRWQLAQDWPELIPDSRKQQLLNQFQTLMSNKELRHHTCAVCGESKNNHDFLPNSMLINLYDVSILEAEYPSPRLNPFPLHPTLSKTIVCPQGVLINNAEHATHWMICRNCDRDLSKKKLPSTALANDLFLGSPPPQLMDLTIIEEAMIAQRRAKTWIIHLKEHDSTSTVNGFSHGGSLPVSQRAMKGHVIVFPSNPQHVTKFLPPNLMVTPMCVVFVGSTKPTKEWLLQHARPLIVRREKVRSALLWLQANNPLYADIVLHTENLNMIPEEDIAPVVIDAHPPSEAEAAQGSRFDADNSADQPEDTFDTPLQNVVITDIDMNDVSANQLTAAAMMHLTSGKDYIAIPHESSPCNEYDYEHLFPLLYPTLFPYGTGCFNQKRKSLLSFQSQGSHFFSLQDTRFQEHYSFLFVFFNILQRRAVAIQTKLKTSRSQFASVASDFANISVGAIQAVLDRLSRGDHATPDNDEEKIVHHLMRDVNVVSMKVPGSAAARVTMRNEICGLMFDCGLPSFYITINPADVYNPIPIRERV